MQLSSKDCFISDQKSCKCRNVMLHRKKLMFHFSVVVCVYLYIDFWSLQHKKKDVTLYEESCIYLKPGIISVRLI